MMIDAALIQQCADPRLKSAIVEQFISRIGISNPLAVTLRAGDRVVLVPKPKTRQEAMALVRRHVGEAVVRVGVTQYPAGLGTTDVSDLKPGLVDACENIRMGTALFGKVYRIVTKWYGAPVNAAFEDAILAWRSGYFEGRAVFSESDPGNAGPAGPDLNFGGSAEKGRSVLGSPVHSMGRSVEPTDPNAAGIRVDLSAIASHRVKAAQKGKTR